MPYESMLASYFGAPILKQNEVKPFSMWTVFDGFVNRTAILNSTSSSYKYFAINLEYIDKTTGTAYPTSLTNSLLGTCNTQVQILTDFTDGTVTTDTFRDYLDAEVNTITTPTWGKENYLEITARQRSTAPGGAHPPQAWFMLTRPLVNNLPQSDIPKICVELDIELPKTLATSLGYPKSGANNWFNYQEIKRGHGQDITIGSPTYGTYEADAGDARNTFGMDRDEQTSLLNWIVRIDDGGNNASFSLPGVADPDGTKRVLREVFTPGLNDWLGKRLIIRMYQRNPANNADRTSGILYVTATNKLTGETKVLAKFIGGEQMGIYSLPYGRIFTGCYSGGATPYGIKLYGHKLYNDWPLDSTVFDEKFKYDDGTCYIPLTNSLNVQRGYGMGTFTRATVATVFDYLGKLLTLPAGVPRFEGARYVQNLLTSTDALATQGVSVTAEPYTISFTGTGSISFSGAYAGSILNGTGTSRVYRTFTPSAGTLTVTVSGNVTNAQLELGSNVSEYVSVGSSSIGLNYHGLGIDGIKAFNTDTSGTAISTSLLKGLLINSSARTNNILWCRDLTNAAWVATNINTSKNQTGIDGYANTCTLVTASSANGTILQTIVTAAVNASSSAYVKRASGSGNIFFTRNGGSTWLDITSEINNSTFTRIKIENTSILNPQIGFKIETSGDSIIVDYVQNETGAEISMPILTTTVAATRNAETLTYPAIHNFNGYGNSPVSGMMLCTFESSNWSTASGSILGSTTAGLFISNSNSGVIAKDGTNTVNGPTGTPTGTVKIGLRYNTSTLETVANGVWSSVGTYDGDFGQGTASTNWLRVGADVNGYIKDVSLWTIALTNQQLIDITS